MKVTWSMAVMDTPRVHTPSRSMLGSCGSYVLASTCGVGGREGERWCEEGDAEPK